jgi:hypothetical protein
MYHAKSKKKGRRLNWVTVGAVGVETVQFAFRTVMLDFGNGMDENNFVVWLVTLSLLAISAIFAIFGFKMMKVLNTYFPEFSVKNRYKISFATKGLSIPIFFILIWEGVIWWFELKHEDFEYNYLLDIVYFLFCVLIPITF